MEIILLDIHSKKSAINKTMAGGFGTSSNYSAKANKSRFTKLLEVVKKSATNIPLIEFAYLSRIFREKGHRVSTHYSGAIPAADLYLVYISLVEYNSEIEAIRTIRMQYPRSKIGLIGTFVTIFPEELKEYSDFVIKGESEGFFKNYEGDYLALSGVVEAPAMDNLDVLPFPDWSFFPLNSFKHSLFFGNVPVYPILGSRGCPFTCSYYCAYPLLAGKRIRFRSIDSILSEISYLRTKYKAKAILFRDPNFSVDINRAKEFCRVLLNNAIKIRWACETHLSRMDKELVDLMWDSGLRAITVGIESISEEVIKTSKRQSVEKRHIMDIINYCETKGIKVMAGYILGNLNDTRETIKDTLTFAKQLNTSFAQFYISTPYPGTQYYYDIKDRINTNNWESFDTYTLVFGHPNLGAVELEKIKEHAYKTYYLRPQWLAKFAKELAYDFFNR